MIATHAELTAICERVHMLILVREIAASHRLEQMYHLRLLEKVSVWRRNDGFDRNEVLAERQGRTQRHVYSVDGSEHCGIKVYFEPRRPPTSQKLITIMWTEMNQLRQEILPPQPPHHNLPPQRSPTRSLPQQPCSVPREISDKETMEPKEKDEGKLRFKYVFASRNISRAR